VSPRIATRADLLAEAALLGEQILDIQVSMWELAGQRAMVILRLWEGGMTTRAIAAATGMSQARVASRLKYARALREEET
jgi:DNA-directed RNA polymerase specialized sigma24 family protein